MSELDSETYQMRLDVGKLGLDDLDSYISSLDKESLSEKAFRNTRVPISRLPCDVFLCIFSISIQLSGLSRTASDKWWDWIVLTRVCSHWRNVILGCPVFWSEIFSFYGCKRMQVYLERSRDVDISINLNLDEKNRVLLLGVVKEHLWRVRKLKLYLLSAITINDFVNQCLSQSAERLKTLELYRCYNINDHIRTLCSLHTLPDYPAVQLQSLTLHSVIISWSSSILGGLSELNLCGIMKDNRPNITQILDILERCPNLRSFHLDCGWTSIEGPMIDEVLCRRIELRMLDKIALGKVPFSMIPLLLTCISIPRHTQSEFSCEHYPFRSPQPFYPKFFEKRLKCQSIIVDFDCCMINVMSFSTLETKMSLPDTCISITIPTFANLEHPEENPLVVMTAVGAILNHPFWQNAINVELSFPNFHLYYVTRYMSRLSWSILFNSLPGCTKTLSINLFKNHMGDFDFDDGLAEAFSEDTYGDAAGYRFPNLRRLVVSRVDFTTQKGLDRKRLLMDHIEKRNLLSGSPPCKLIFEEYQIGTKYVSLSETLNLAL